MFVKPLQHISNPYVTAKSTIEQFFIGLHIRSNPIKKELKALAEECATKLKPIKQNEAKLTSSLRDNQEDQNEIQRAIKKKKDEIKQLETIRSKNANPELKEKLDQARV